jgi:hypothetical protein
MGTFTNTPTSKIDESAITVMAETPKLQTLLDDITKAQERARSQGEDAIKEAFAKFFELAPNVYAVIWAQYAPYFNDGGACTFSVNEPEFRTEADTEDLDYGNGDSEEINLTPEAEKFWADNLSNLFSRRAAEDVMKSVFGDDSLVVATREGFDIQEYSHD